MLKIDHLCKNYGSFPALRDLSLEIPDGALHGFVGPNGAGKTTTMRILATLMKPTSGTAYVNDTDVVKDGQKARKLVGYMPDFFGVYDSLKCWEYLDFYARCYRIGATERKRMTRQLLELVQLEEKENEYVDALSRGMKQRLCLARSLIHDPKLLILDEPASGMDPRARAEMKGILRTLREMGKTVLISSHILPELAEMCDSLTILDHGQLVFSGSVEALSDRMNGNAPLDIRLTEGCGEENVESAVRCLKELPSVTEIVKEEPYLLRVRLEEGADCCPDVLRQLVMKDVPVCDFHRAPMNLEKVFMEVTQGA
ncbi:ABC transporter ATP-binding protein [Aristaeella lactis]|uniref:ABC-2 type transport system ATP-binding protein n=1 Tax=Aristaeella lactis TaxID=3046383 RepID=A0AC61PM45_9FIRM|nr:ABC transporter ATP-binding protein [Aristaeella lactis]QUA53053.1 ABC transporter ATP-binding protein [Aristaeella lactis]SMC67011.1 ABC-2 type transport system ATP-binding protein [Aristaeella lactis]